MFKYRLQYWDSLYKKWKDSDLYFIFLNRAAKAAALRVVDHTFVSRWRIVRNVDNSVICKFERKRNG